MKISPDGSLPRITSSSKGVTRHMKIIKVPENEVKEDGLSYKLVWTGAVESESESENSEEEPWLEKDYSKIDLSANCPDIQLPDIQLPDIQFDVKCKDSKIEDNKSESKGSRNSKNDRYRSPNSRHRNFKKDSNAKNFGRKFNSSSDINPWAIPSVPPFPFYPFRYPQPVPVIEQTLPNRSAENCMQSVGLLGDSPYSPPRCNFAPPNRQSDNFTPPNRQNDNFMPPNRQNDNFTLPSRQNNNFPSNRQNDNFLNDQNYWNREYCEYPPKNNFQRRPSHMRGPVHRQSNFPRRKRNWKDKNQNNDWHKKGMDKNGRFDYRKYK